jgi:hypothetical protein
LTCRLGAYAASSTSVNVTFRDGMRIG